MAIFGTVFFDVIWRAPPASFFDPSKNDSQGTEGKGHFGTESGQSVARSEVKARKADWPEGEN